MLIISDCLTEIVDEGCLKVANTLAARIKKKNPAATIVSYKRKSPLSDIFLALNPLFLNSSLISLLKKEKEQVLYIPFASNTTGSTLRLCVLSLFSSCRLKVVFALCHPMNFLSKILLKISRAEVIALSKKSFEFYRSIVKSKAMHLKAGVDTEKFCPADNLKKSELREKFKVCEGKIAVLHVGHLKNGRNIDKLCRLNDNFHIFLLLSSVTESESDRELLEMLNSRKNTTVLKGYLENVEEIYQMADVYFFPVVEKGQCIDLPLSVLEAAACSIPVVCTDYGELSELSGKKGFSLIKSFDEEYLNQLVLKAAEQNEKSGRESAKEYDWSAAVDKILQST